MYIEQLMSRTTFVVTVVLKKRDFSSYMPCALMKCFFWVLYTQKSQYKTFKQQSTTNSSLHSGIVFG